MLQSKLPPATKTMERAGRLIRKLNLSPELAGPETRARAAWALAAGTKIAEHTRAVALVRGTLVVETEDIVWQRQLASLRHFLLRNLAEALGEVLVTDIDLRPMPPRRKPQRAETARPAGAIADEADRIQDPIMRMLYLQSKKRESA
jgi:predicted nucleic acid-binding Zn ribbon protein